MLTDAATDLGLRYAHLIFEARPDEIREEYCEYDSDEAVIEAVATDIRNDINDGYVGYDIRHLKEICLVDNPEMEAERNFLVSEMKKAARDAKSITKNPLKIQKETAKCNL